MLKLHHCKLRLIAAAILGSVSLAVYAGEKALDRFDAASEYYSRGAFAEAIGAWRSAIAATDLEDASLRLRSHLGIAAANQQIGLYQDAQAELSKAERLLDSVSDVVLLAQYRRQLGNLNMAMNRYDEALESLAAASTHASDAGQPALQAAILNEYGNALAVSGYTTDALTAYDRAREIASRLQMPSTALAAATNGIRLQVVRGDRDAAAAALQSTFDSWKAMTPTYDWALAGFALLELRLKLQSTQDENEIETLRADVLSRIEDHARQSQNQQLLARVQLRRGQAERGPESDAALRKAAMTAAQNQMPQVAYAAYWRLAQLQRARGEFADAIRSFEQALAVLNPIRDELLNGYRDTHEFFNSRVRPVYAEFAATLIADAARSGESQGQHSNLERARNAIEALRSAELQDYFRDECVIERRSRSMALEQATVGAAILYPVILDDRIELLLAIDGGLRRFSSEVSQDQLNEAALRLREFVQDGDHDRFMPYANRLYRWLIAPIKSTLVDAGVDTLIVVPDGALRSIPFGALHSGERYLIEEYSLAMTPGLELTAPSQPSTTERNALLAGLAQPVQGFAPLPKVQDELQDIHRLYGGRVLSNSEYTKANVRAALETGSYSIVHLATHGIVGATPADSFLLTSDGRLSMSDLEELLRIGEFRDRNIDLLTLSACDTAVGDERAALGLAGIAVKSGAASVVASLWRVDDEATAALMNRFYERLHATGGGAKAHALRAAQLGMLGDAATAHPANWAAFMLIGNWQ